MCKNGQKKITFTERQMRCKRDIEPFLAPGGHTVSIYPWPDDPKKYLTRSSIDLKTLPGQAHYLSVRAPTPPIKVPKWDLLLTERSESEALPMLKKMKPSP